MSYCAIRFVSGQNGQIDIDFFEQRRQELSKNYVRIRVKAFALNQADIMQARGKYPPPPGESDIPGLEFSGEVIESRYTGFSAGDWVMALVGSGAYAQECVVHASLLRAMPHDYSFIEAAALPEALTTVHATVFDARKPQLHQRILMHGAASGITSLAAQMLALSGMQASICGRSLKKMASLPRYDRITYHEVNSPEDLLESRFGLYDRIVDILGGEYTKMHLDLLKPTGQLLQMACMEGAKVELFLPTLMRKRLKLEGFVLRSQSIPAKAKLYHQACDYWLGLSTPPKPMVDSVFGFAKTDIALQRMASSEHIGKIVVTVD